MNHWQPGILLWTVGDRLRWCAERNRSSETFKHLWLTIKCWHRGAQALGRRLWYVSDGYPVYSSFIEPEDPECE